MTLLQPQRTARSGQNVKRCLGYQETWAGQGTDQKNLYLVGIQRSSAEKISICDVTKGRSVDREGPKPGAGLYMREIGKGGKKGCRRRPQFPQVGETNSECSLAHPLIIRY